MLKTGPQLMTQGMLIVILMSVGVSCNKKEEPTTAKQPAAQAPAPQAAPPAPPTVAASPSQPAAEGDPVLAKASPANAYDISLNPELKGRMGRLIVAFPEGANTGGVRIDVYKGGESNASKAEYGNQTIDLLPGTYAVGIAGKRVEGVPIQSGHDTKLKVGVLRITAGKNTRVDLLDPATKKALTGGYGNQQFGLPIGPVSVSVAGQSEPVTVQEGKITDF